MSSKSILASLPCREQANQPHELHVLLGHESLCDEVASKIPHRRCSVPRCASCQTPIAVRLSASTDRTSPKRAESGRATIHHSGRSLASQKQRDEMTPNAEASSKNVCVSLHGILEGKGDFILGEGASFKPQSPYVIFSSVWSGPLRTVDPVASVPRRTTRVYDNLSLSWRAVVGCRNFFHGRLICAFTRRGRGDGLSGTVLARTFAGNDRGNGNDLGGIICSDFSIRIVLYTTHPLLGDRDGLCGELGSLLRYRNSILHPFSSLSLSLLDRGDGSRGSRGSALSDGECSRGCALLVVA